MVKVVKWTVMNPYAGFCYFSFGKTRKDSLERFLMGQEGTTDIARWKYYEFAGWRCVRVKIEEI